MENLFERRLKSGSVNVARLKNDIRFLLGKIKKIQSAVERAFWIKELSRRTAVSESALTEEMDGLAPDSFSPQNDGQAVSGTTAAVSPGEGAGKSGAVLAENGRWGLVAEQLLSLALAKRNFPVLLTTILIIFPKFIGKFTPPFPAASRPPVPRKRPMPSTFCICGPAGKRRKYPRKNFSGRWTNWQDS